MVGENRGYGVNGENTRPTAQAGGVVLWVIVIIIAVVVIIGALYYMGYLGRFTVVFSENGTRVEYTSPGEREREVVGALKKFSAAQKIFKEKFGSYAPFPEALIGIGEVDGNIGTANDPMWAFEDYYFIGLEKQADGKVNLNKGFVFAAVPAAYGRDTKYTYVTGPTGRIFRKDVGAEPISDAATVDGAWKEVR